MPSNEVCITSWDYIQFLNVTSSNTRITWDFTTCTRISLKWMSKIDFQYKEIQILFIMEKNYHIIIWSVGYFVKLIFIFPYSKNMLIKNVHSYIFWMSEGYRAYINFLHWAKSVSLFSIIMLSLPRTNYLIRQQRILSTKRNSYEDRKVLFCSQTF